MKFNRPQQQLSLKSFPFVSTIFTINVLYTHVHVMYSLYLLFSANLVKRTIWWRQEHFKENWDKSQIFEDIPTNFSSNSKKEISDYLVLIVSWITKFSWYLPTSLSSTIQKNPFSKKSLFSHLGTCKESSACSLISVSHQLLKETCLDQ